VVSVIQLEKLFIGHADFRSVFPNSSMTVFHIPTPRPSTYRFGQRTNSASVRSSNPLRTIRPASVRLFPRAPDSLRNDRS
jgi:hypothetical protein